MKTTRFVDLIEALIDGMVEEWRRCPTRETFFALRSLRRTYGRLRSASR